MERAKQRKIRNPFIYVPIIKWASETLEGLRVLSFSTNNTIEDKATVLIPVFVTSCQM